MPSQKNDSIKRAEKKMEKYPIGTVKLQIRNDPEDSPMLSPNGVEKIRLLGFNSSHNGRQDYYTYNSKTTCPEFKFAYNCITQRAFLISEDNTRETFILNNKERSAFDGFIIISWISLYSHIIYMVILMGDGNDFSLFQGKCNGKFGEHIKQSMLNVRQTFGENLLKINDKENNCERKVQKVSYDKEI